MEERVILKVLNPLELERNLEFWIKSIQLQTVQEVWAALSEWLANELFKSFATLPL